MTSLASTYGVQIMDDILNLDVYIQPLNQILPER